MLHLKTIEPYRPSSLYLFDLSVMDMELFDRWVYLSMTLLLQMMMLLQPLPHPQNPMQVGTHKKQKQNITTP